MQLYDRKGHRKYLTPDECRAFIEAADDAPCAVRTFCGTLAHTGCRISEELALTTGHIDLAAGALIFETLKRRRKGIFRAVPVPPSFLGELAAVHNLQNQTNHTDLDCARPLWPWSRATAWRRVCGVMQAAGITGPHACPKGLRHGFGIRAISAGIPLNMAQKWLGHARLSTTAIYVDATGAEEQKLAQRMWRIL